MKLKKRLISLTIASLLLIIGDFTFGDTVRFEAEGGLLTGPLVSVSNEVAGYSGEGYVTGFQQVDPNNETVTVAVYADSPGNYPLTVGYRSPYSDKTNTILVNDINIGYATFILSEVFTELFIGDISLVAGINTVTFSAVGGEGWMDVDYFEIDGLSHQAMDPQPAHRSTVSSSLSQLCWKNPDPGLGDIVTCDVYFGTNEPNDLLPDYGLSKIASGMWGNCIDIPYELDDLHVYYWIVDCWDYNSGSPILLRGGAWQFATGISPTLLEAEDGLISGPEVSISDYVEGFSGTGYVTGFNQIDSPNEKATVSVYASSAGDYPLSIGYRSDYGEKTQYLFVNDVQLDNAVFPLTDYWGVLEYGDIALEQGVNTITISTYWGYIYLDYFAIQGLEPAAISPKPAHLATVGTDLAQLCWTNPDPGPGDTITCDVYFGEEPNELLDNYGLPQIASGTSDSCVDIPISLVQPHDYYWLVNCWDSEGGSPVLLQGGLWNFKTGNTPPDPNTGPDRYVWLGKDGTPGEVTVNVDASVIDDGLPSDTLIYTWTQTDGTSVIIDPDDVEDISIIFTEEGDYSFRLTVSDTEFEAIDNLDIGVRSTPCDAAKADPWYWAYDGDLNEDCYVNISDFELLAMDWMNCVDPQGCQ
jgi:hypothetical protein